MPTAVQIASKFIASTPPGEFHEVLNDLRVLVNDDASLQSGIKDAVVEYNLQQLIVAKVPNSDRSVCVSKYNQLEDGSFADARGKQKFKFDHIKQAVVSVEPFTVPEDAQRAALDDQLAKYTQEHYPNGVGLTSSKDGALVMVIASNKFNPGNFWNGRWRSVWTLKGGQLVGHLKVHVHYYEDGNVQLVSDKEVSISSDGKPESVLKAIKDAEVEYQNSLNESYVQLSDNTFKSLRRALPVTRNKVDWNKILSYKVTLGK